MSTPILVAGLVVMSVLLSIPCGYIRQNYSRNTFMWYLLIHLPIPFIVLLRLKAGLDWGVIPLTLFGSIAGQFAGGYLNRRRGKYVKSS